MNWLTNMFRSGRRTQQIVDMIGMRRDNNRNGVMLSLVGLGLGAVAYGILRGRNNGNNTPRVLVDPDMPARNPIS